MAPSARRSPVFVVFLTVFIDLLGFGIVVPLLPDFAEDYGATSFVAGLLVASYSLAQFVFAPIWGAISDRVGRRPILTITLAGNAIAYSLYAVAGGLPLLFVSRTLSGIFAANISTAQAYMADVTTKENRTKAMGLVGMAFGLGFVLGPVFGGLLGQYVGLWAPGAAAAALSATACAVATFRLPESLPPHLRAKAGRRGHPILDLKTAARNPSIGGLLALFFFLIFGFANLESMLPLFLSDRFGFDKAQSGFVFAYIGVCIAFAQGFLVGRVARRYGEARLLKVGPLLIVVGLQAYWLAPSLALFLLAVPAVAVGMGISNPSVASLLSKRSPPDVQGRTLGLSQSLGALARALSPGLAGFLYGEFPREGGSIAPMIWGGLVVLIGLAWGWKALSRDVPPSVPSPPPPPVG